MNRRAKTVNGTWESKSSWKKSRIERVSVSESVGSRIRVEEVQDGGDSG